MANTSATGGYLSPAASPAPSEDAALEDIFQSAIVGVTSIDGKLVRPRWQPKPPKQPSADTDWIAFGVIRQTPDASPYIEHNGGGDGKDTMKRHEDIELAITCYGPNGSKYATILRDSFWLPQNNEGLNAHSISFVDGHEMRPFPELVNQQWIRRHDITLRFRREVVRDYAILNIEAADIGLIDDTGRVNETIVIDNRPPTPPTPEPEPEN